MYNTTDMNVVPIPLTIPPHVPPLPLGSFIWTPFNKTPSVVSFGRENKAFGSAIVDGKRTGSGHGMKMVASDPTPGGTAMVSRTLQAILNNLHCGDTDASILIGSNIMSRNGLCPTFWAGNNNNLFGHYFGIEFKLDNRFYVRPISPCEFMRCFGPTNDLTYKLSQPQSKFSSDPGFPRRTSVWVLDYFNERLGQLRDEICQVFDPSQYAVPASLCQTSVNIAIDTRLLNVNT